MQKIWLTLDFFIFEYCRLQWDNTKVRADVLDKHWIDKTYVDSTVKTGRNKLEHFGVMLSRFWAGIPLAYLALEPGTQEAYR